MHVIIFLVAGLLRREVLRVWKEKNMMQATYRLLLSKCLEGNDIRTAKKICDVLARCPGRESSVHHERMVKPGK